MPQRYRFSSKSQRVVSDTKGDNRCFWCHKGTDFQANHNCSHINVNQTLVVFDATKVQIFKQITTCSLSCLIVRLLFLMPQRYRFSSKSQHFLTKAITLLCCFWCHKGTDFQANHNAWLHGYSEQSVVFDATKVQIFKQITTWPLFIRFRKSCFWCHKGTDFQANHNLSFYPPLIPPVVFDATKVQIFKQIKCRNILMKGKKRVYNRYHKHGIF